MATSKPVFKTTSKKPNLPNYTVEFQDGEFIFNEGDLGMEMYIIHEGKIEILKQMQAERSQLAVLEKGDFFGEMSILEDLPPARRQCPPPTIVDNFHSWKHWQLCVIHAHDFIRRACR